MWEYIKDIGSHVDWMRDAVAIRFTSSQRDGVGTTFECDTRIGPFTTLDHMEVTEWEPDRAIAIRHRGVVTGEGRFALEPIDGGTRFVWTERLRFPWWQGGRVSGSVARPILRRVWRANLERLRDLVEGGVER